MTVFDYVFLAILALSTVIGLWRGLVSEVMALVAWVLALFLAWRYAHVVAPWFSGWINEPAWRHVAGFAAVFVAVLLVAALLRFLLRELLRAIGLGTADRLFGAVFGLLRGLAIALLIVLLGGMVGISRESWWSNALFAPPLETAVIAAKPWLPDVVASKVRFR
ncbi:CvpA family protein [Pseudothauera rhizosphaerae]|uniref:CvpA family protein n=1 Tax=Pseudothauera rhizosphaerae TaxID=2565932 RepID=A0A4S4ATI8_9RHOO|nr:CvpA family protein [Pseudothauera rhizosphaerae]THF62489.1 CvpA family protein [Pseudothauera rhizosphaerae]